MKIKFLNTFFGLLCITNLYSQQIPELNDSPFRYSNNEFYSLFLINPSYTGFNKTHDFQFHTFDQWVSGNSALSYYSISYNGFFKSINSGFGVYGNLESYGDSDKRQYISGFYNYEFKIGQEFLVNIGTQLGIIRRRISNEMFLIKDQIFFGSGKWENSPKLDVGFNFSFKNFNLGLNYENLIENYYTSSFNVETELFKKCFIANASYRIIALDKFEFKPYITNYFKSDNSISFGLHSIFDNKYTVGFGYNTGMKKIQGTISVTIFKIIRIGYIYESTPDNRYSGLIINGIFKPSR